jgi:hypothetical protein
VRVLKWEVMNIELHCIFDSWNEEIMQICSVRAGFSGIGLNELTLSMINHNRHIPEKRVEEVVRDAKKVVVEIVTDERKILDKIVS